MLSQNEGFLVYRFEKATENPADYLDHEKFFTLKQIGEKAIADENFDELRKVLSALAYLRAVSTDDDSLVNIFKA